MNFQQVLHFVRDRLVYVWIVSVCLWLTWWGWLLLTSLGYLHDDSKVFTDHMAFYSGARLIAEGRGEIMYDYDQLGIEQRKMVGFDDGGFTLTAIRNPPFYPLLYLPTAKLPYLISFWIWDIIALLLLYLGFRLLGVERPLIAMAWATSFYPVYTVITFGQNSMISFAILCGVYFSLRRDRKLIAGGLAGLLSFKPTVMLGLCIWWLLDIRRYWKCWLGMMITGLILLGISLLFVRKEFELFLEKLGEIAAYNRDEFYNHHTMRAFWGYLFGDDKQIGLVLGSITSLLFIICFVIFWLRHRNSLPVMFAGVVYFTLMITPHALVYEWSLSLITAVILWREFPANRDRWLILFAIPWVVLLIGTQSTKFQKEWLDGYALHFSPLILCVMGFVLARELKASVAA